MNEQTINVMLALIRKVVCGGELDAEMQKMLTVEILPSLYSLSKAHDMAHIVAQELAEQGLLGDDEYSKKFQKQQMLAVYRYQKLTHDLTLICQAFEEDQIMFLPLKGSVLRTYYPEAWMRTSCDIDVLVHEEDLERAVASLERYGFQVEKKGSHDVSIYSQNGMHVELHFSMVEDGRAVNAPEVLADIWQSAVPKEGSSYHMLLKDDMFYFYHIAHIAKHFENCGCGVRPFLDLWILLHRVEHDEEARKQILRRGGLLKFEEASRALAAVWFDGAASNKMLEQMQRYVLASGIYGTMDHRVVAQQSKRGSGLKYVLSRIFVPYDHLKYLYPVLQKHKWLYPIMLVRRCFRVFFKGRIKRIKRELDINSDMSQEKLAETTELFTSLGLQ